jgi:hypothetical protein
MNHIPTVRRISDISPIQDAVRVHLQTYLDNNNSYSEAAKTCPKPV